VLGIVGAAIASAILSYFGIVLGGWFGYLMSGFIGAVLLISSEPYGRLEDIKATSTMQVCVRQRCGANRRTCRACAAPVTLPNTRHGASIPRTLMARLPIQTIRGSKLDVTPGGHGRFFEVTRPAARKFPACV
jgi:hypothetical protein